MTARGRSSEAARDRHLTVTAPLRALAWASLSAFALAAACGDVQGVGIRGIARDAGASGDGATSTPPDGGSSTVDPCSLGCAGVTPVCNAATGQCVECLVAAHCAGTGKSYCQPTRNRCSECLDSGDCQQGMICDPDRGACVTTCASGADCNGDLCDFAHGYCVDCVSSSDCTTTEAPVCNVQVGRCVQCGATSDCPAGVCDTFTGSCVECTSQLACGLGRTCDLVSGECVPSCGSDRDCPGDKPFCDPSLALCVECLSSSNCRDSSFPVCSPVTHRCYACLSDRDCPDMSKHVCLVQSHTCGQCAADANCPTGLSCDIASAQCR